MALVKVLTIHDIGNNFGSTLQACALCEYLEANGYDVELVDYKPVYAYHHGKVTELIKWVMFPKSKYLQEKRFREYFKKHVIRTKRYNNYQELCDDEIPDIYIIGSDQVWNSFYEAGKDPAYYLKFTECPKKMAYSTSLGQLHSKEELIRVKERVKDFYAIGVREKASSEQLHEIGMKDVVHVLDPVFLFPREYYIDPNFSNEYGSYVLVYSVNNDTLMEKTAERIARKYGLKIVLVGGFTQKTKHDIYLRDIGPREFVNLMNNAFFVVANSFHATALSIILNKNFAVVMSKYSPLRITDMLETAGLESRLIESEEMIDSIPLEINYKSVNPRIEQMRIKSETFLLGKLEELAKGSKNKETKTII